VNRVKAALFRLHCPEKNTQPEYKTTRKMSKKSLSYTEAVKEIELILHQIENEELDVDDLAEKVKRAYFLLKLCKEKLHSTEKDIENIMKDFDPG
jgi:exodeoxyribonuclease VII small subunit